ncbi:hypothetical protein PInf_024193 [Phytophthora infestans]|nr:hypothetical protein PInf_024193 [Phytophthora infestans]
MDKDLLQKEQRLYEDWLSHQPPAVERRKYPIPTAVEKRLPPVENGPERETSRKRRRHINFRGARGDPAINSAFKLEDVRADRTPVLRDGQDVSYHLSKIEDDGAVTDASTNSAVEGTSAVGTKEVASATEDSAITEGVLRDEQTVIDDRSKFEVIRPSIVSEVYSAISTLSTMSAGINHVVTANSALEDPAVINDLGVIPACPKTADYAGERDDCKFQAGGITSKDVEASIEGLSWVVKTSSHSDEGEAPAEYVVDGLSSAAVVSSAMGTPKACIIQSATVDSTSADLNAESESDTTTACRQDHYDATEYYDNRKVLLNAGN